MSKADPFRTFAFDCEEPIRSARAHIIATQHMADSKNPEEEVVDSIGHLANDAWERLDQVLSALGLALAAARERS